jgi:hypothetical protein
MMENNQSLLRVAEEFTFQYGIGVIPTNDLKHPIIEKVIDKRGRSSTREELEDYFAPNGTKRAQYLVVLLDSPKLLVALDLDGNGLVVFEKKVLPRCSEGLKIAINTTMRTKTPSNGLHIIFGIRSEDFPTGVHTREYWSELGNDNGHNQINLMGTGFYLVERGPRYEPINDVECLIILSGKQVGELLTILERLEMETNAIRIICNKLVPYYHSTNRQKISLRVAGYLHKHGVPEQLICDLLEHLIGLVGGDEESEKRYQAVKDTCAKNAKTNRVSGYTKLLEAINGDNSVIVIIQNEIGKLGYHFNSNGNARTGTESNNNEDQQSEETFNMATALLKIIEPKIAELFKDQLNNSFAAIWINGHIETIPIP